MPSVAGEFGAHVANAIPAADRCMGVCLRNMPGQGEHQAQCQLGNAYGVRGRRVADDDARLRSRGDVNVDSDAGSGDDFELLCRGDQIGRDLGLVANDQGLCIASAALSSSASARGAGCKIRRVC